MKDSQITLLNPKDVAERLGVTTRTLFTMRSEGVGPKFINLTRSKRPIIRYDKGDVESWLKKQRTL